MLCRSNKYEPPSAAEEAERPEDFAPWAFGGNKSLDPQLVERIRLFPGKPQLRKATVFLSTANSLSDIGKIVGDRQETATHAARSKYCLYSFYFYQMT